MSFGGAGGRFYYPYAKLTSCHPSKSVNLNISKHSFRLLNILTYMQRDGRVFSAVQKLHFDH